jgi:hypothetical protein
MAENDPWLNWSWLKIGPFTPTREEQVGADRRLQEIKEQDRRNATERSRQSAADIRDVFPVTAEPLISVPGFRVGPILTSDEERAAYEKRDAEIKAGEKADRKARLEAKKGIRQQNANEAAIAYEEERRRNISQQLEAERRAAAPYPEKWEDWTWQNRIGAALGPQEGYDASLRAREDYERRNGMIGGEDVPFTPLTGVPQGLGGPAPQQQGPQLPPGGMPQATPAEVPVEAAPVDPRQQMIEDIKRQRELIDTIYPSRQFDQSGEAALAADEDKDRERTKALAELAFFSGIAKAGGGAWEQVGSGLAGAGQVYASGFNRYQNALQRRANRSQSQLDQRYSDDAARAGAAVKLYSDEKDATKAALKVAREERKDRRKEIMDYFKTIEPKVGDFPTPEDQKKRERWQRSLDVSLAQGEIVQMNNRD